jgi:cytochrome c-type biogenesis protein CcmH
MALGTEAPPTALAGQGQPLTSGTATSRALVTEAVAGGTGGLGVGTTGALSPARRRRRWPAWVGVAFALGLALAAGGGAFGGHSGPQSLYQRTMAVSGQYRCPVCAGESAAQSDAPAAVEIRDQVQLWLQEGRSQAQIRSYLLHDYGPSILEKPPASGFSALVWVLPAVATAGAVAGLTLAFARWRKAGLAYPGLAYPGLAYPGLASAGPAAELAPPGAEVGPAPQELVTQEPVAQEPVLQEPVLQEPVPGPPPDKGATRPLQRWTLVVGVALVVLAGGLWALDRSSAPRSAGQSVTGVTPTGATGVAAELSEAAGLAIKQPLSALVIYDEVLTTDPKQPVALTAAGWIYAEAGYTSKGLKMLVQAEAASPSYPPPHLYRGLLLLDNEHQAAAAATELRWYLGHGPSSVMVKVARKALGQAVAEQAAASRS